MKKLLILILALGFYGTYAQIGIITTIAGNGTFGFNGDGGPATAAGSWYPTGVLLL